jgi:hypothetical protein
MSYIGSTPTTQSFIAGTDYFNGNGSTVNFTLSRCVNSVNDIEVIVNNVEQIPSGYSVSGTTLTFSAAPSAGTSNVYVRYLSTTNLSLAIPAGTSATFNTVTATNLTVTNDATINGVKVGKGAGAVATNTAVGASALAANTTGASGVAIGNGALQSNTTASNNTAVGYQAGYSNTTGVRNAYFGYLAGYANNGTDNLYCGYSAGDVHTGNNSAFVGTLSGQASTTGSSNTYVGTEAGYSATTPSDNTFVGRAAGYNITTGSKNTIIGRYNGSGGPISATGSNWIVLSDGDGNVGMSINPTTGNVSMVSAAGAGTNALKYNTGNGAVTYDTSSARYKDNIRDSIYGLSHVLQMRSTQFEYKDTGRSDVGLIAEELDPIIPELVGKNKDGQADSVSYDRMVSVLVKAIQEQQALITALTTRITALENNNATQ